VGAARAGKPACAAPPFSGAARVAFPAAGLRKSDNHYAQKALVFRRPFGYCDHHL